MRKSKMLEKPDPEGNARAIANQTTETHITNIAPFNSRISTSQCRMKLKREVA